MIKTAFLLAAMASVTCSNMVQAAPQEWECTAPPNYSRHIGNGITNGPLYSVSGEVSGIHNDKQTGEWSPSASAVIFTPDKSIVAALRIVGNGSASTSSYDIVFERNFGAGMITERLGKIGSGKKLTFALSWSSDGMVTANLNGQKRTVGSKPLGEAIVETACSGGAFTFTDLQFSPEGDDSERGPVKAAAMDSHL
jgi:hypothetical protein